MTEEKLSNEELTMNMTNQTSMKRTEEITMNKTEKTI